MPDARSVILVGHCMPDKFMLRSAVKRLVPGSDIVTVNDAKKLAKHASSQSVLLVNRVLDGRFDTRSGIELIETLDAADDPPVAILISNAIRARLAPYPYARLSLELSLNPVSPSPTIPASASTNPSP